MNLSQSGSAFTYSTHVDGFDVVDSSIVFQVYVSHMNVVLWEISIGITSSGYVKTVVDGKRLHSVDLNLDGCRRQQDLRSLVCALYTSVT